MREKQPTTQAVVLLVLPKETLHCVTFHNVMTSLFTKHANFMTVTRSVSKAFVFNFERDLKDYGIGGCPKLTFIFSARKIYCMEFG